MSLAAMGNARTTHQGTLAEHLVAVDLMKRGYSVSMATYGLRYDLILDANGKLYRVQVKSTETKRPLNERRVSPVYLFRLNKTYNNGKLRKQYSSTDFDIIACIVLETGEIAYLDSSHATKKTIQLKPKGFPKHVRRKNTFNIDELPLEAILKEIA